MHEDKSVQQEVLFLQRWLDWRNGGVNYDSWTGKAAFV